MTGLNRKLNEREDAYKISFPRDELQTALKSLHEAGINVVAIHSHMTGDVRIIFFH